MSRPESTTAHGRRRLLALATLLWPWLAACEQVTGAGGSLPAETFAFAYVFAVPVGGDYDVPMRNAGGCTNPMLVRYSVTDLVAELRSPLSRFEDELCVTPMGVLNAEAQAVRNGGGFFGALYTGGGSNVDLYLNSSGRPAGTPQSLLLQTTSGIATGQTATGIGTISHGTSVFGCERLLEVRPTRLRQSPDRVEGEFRCVGTRQSGDVDPRLLIIIGGSFGVNRR